VTVCDGRGGPDGDCCWIEGARCPHVIDAGDRVLCGLRLELGSWAKVHADPRWIRDVKPTYDRLWPGYGCGDYPQNIPAVMNNPDAGKSCWEARR